MGPPHEVSSSGNVTTWKYYFYRSLDVPADVILFKSVLLERPIDKWRPPLDGFFVFRFAGGALTEPPERVLLKSRSDRDDGG